MQVNIKFNISKTAIIIVLSVIVVCIIAVSSWVIARSKPVKRDTYPEQNIPQIQDPQLGLQDPYGDIEEPTATPYPATQPTNQPTPKPTRKPTPKPNFPKMLPPLSGTISMKFSEEPIYSKTIEDMRPHLGMDIKGSL